MVVSKLREKRIVQIVLSYLAVGWAILEVTDQLSGRGVLPDTAYTVALVWVGAGLFASFLIGWHHGEKGEQEAPRSEKILLSFLALFALTGSGFVVRQDLTAARMRSAAEYPLELRSVAVMYLRDFTRDPDLAYVADGLTEDLITTLKQVRELDVLSKNATLQFRDDDTPADSVAKVLNAGTIVAGSVEKRGNQLQVNLELIDGASGVVAHRSKITRPINELLAVRDGVVQEAAQLLRQWIGKELRLRQSAHGTKVREAWALVQRAERAHKDAEAVIKQAGFSAGSADFKRADEYLAQATRLDPEWAEPLIQRASLLFRQARLAIGGGVNEEVTALLDVGVEHAEAALKLAPNEPRALEMRGSLKYLKWLMNVTPDAAERARLLEDSRNDLKTALELDGKLASAHATYGHLLGNVEGLAASLVENRRAYEEDAYLESADVVLARLFWGNFDLNNMTQAKEWCDKGAKRFPADYRFALCELMLMTMPAAKPDVENAWRLRASIDSLAPAPRREHEGLRAELAVGGVLARAELSDSARAVLKRAHQRLTPEVDPAYDLLWMESAMYLMLGDMDTAFKHAQRAVLGNPDQALDPGGEIPWFLRDLQKHPRFQELVASQ